jgi:hypothetical protein
VNSSCIKGLRGIRWAYSKRMQGSLRILLSLLMYRYVLIGKTLVRPSFSVRTSTGMHLVLSGFVPQWQIT